MSGATIDAFARVAQLVAELEQLEDERARDGARGIAAAVLDVHRGALARLLEIAAAHGEAGRGVVEAFARDELGRSVLLLHGLHPEPLALRAQAALERVHAHLAAHGARAHLVEDEGHLRVRLERTGERAPRAVELSREVEEALVAAAPDAESIEVEAEDAGTDGFVPLARLRSSAAGVHLARAAPAGRCELCAQPLDPAHEHLFEAARRALSCTCTACALLFDGDASRPGRRRVKRRVRPIATLHLDDARWSALGVPVGLAFLYWSTAAGGPLAVYPGPAGAIEAAVASEAWDGLLAQAPELGELEPDIEALLVRRPRLGEGRGVSATAAAAYLVVSIDLCYELVGLLRAHWRGFGGGDEAWRALDDFFAGLEGGRIMHGELAVAAGAAR